MSSCASYETIVIVFGRDDYFLCTTIPEGILYIYLLAFGLMPPALSFRLLIGDWCGAHARLNVVSNAS